MSDDISEESLSSKIDQLTKMTKSTSENIKGKEKCFPTLLIVGIITPIIIWMLFYFIRPSFVQKKNTDGTYTRDNKKVLLWTFIISVVVWVCLYLWTYCKGYDKNAFTCFKK